MRCEDIGCLNYRFTTASLPDVESLLHLFKLEYRGPEFEGSDCERGRYKAVSENPHVELDNSDVSMLNIEFPTPINFFCKKCVDTSGIPSKLLTRKLSTKTILHDLAVSDVIGCEERLRKIVLEKFKDSDRHVQVYK